MCCKSSKCFGEWSQLAARVDGFVKFATVVDLAQALQWQWGRPVIELLGPSGWNRVVKIEQTGFEKVYRLPDWPVFLTGDHRVQGVKASTINGSTAVRDETVYEIVTAREGAIIVGPYQIAVTQEETEPCSPKPPSLTEKPSS